MSASNPSGAACGGKRLPQPKQGFPMKIRKITAFVIKASAYYDMGGDSKPTGQLPGSDYFRFEPFPQLYSQKTESMIVRIETDTGIVGWGETQAPIGPEVAQAIVEKILGPSILGRSPLDTNLRFTEMYETLRVRGQTTGFMMDAIAGIDTALWDIRGKAAGMSVSRLLGGRYRETLPCYVSGMRRDTIGERIEEAKEFISQGHSRFKPFLGYGVKADGAEIEALRNALGPDVTLFIDAVWKYGFPDAVRLGRVCEEFGVGFLEAPLYPEDIEGHARLARELDVAIAVGEPLRTRFQFQQWLLRDAMDILQPDLMRNGISETFKIAMVAEAFNKPVALHTGTLTTVGMAATYQVAAAIPNHHVQEWQPVMFERFNRWLKSPIVVRNGEIVVPDGPGLGIDIDEDAFMKDVGGRIDIELS
jgi:L-alanine-DL-glutamate epimerase-like enolase superfamily enzyme